MEWVQEKIGGEIGQSRTALSSMGHYTQGTIEHWKWGYSDLKCAIRVTWASEYNYKENVKYLSNNSYMLKRYYFWICWVK